MSKEREEIYHLLCEDHPVEASPKEIAEALEKKSGNIRKLLSEMTKDKQIERVQQGQYRAILNF